MKIWKTIKSRPYWSAAVILTVSLGVLYFALFRGQKAEPPTVEVKRGDVLQEVSVTGKTVPLTNVNLSFEKSGRIKAIYVKVGDAVKEGDLLMELDNSELLAQLQQAEASVAAEEARFRELRRGSREEEIEVKRAELAKAEQDLANYYLNVPTVVQDAYNKADDAVRNQVSTLFTGDKELNPQLSFSVSAAQKEIDAENQRLAASVILNSWKTNLDKLNLTSSREVMDAELSRAKNNLLTLRSFMDTLIEATVNSTSLSPAIQNTYLASVTAARANINSAITSVSSQEQAISSQKLAIKKIENELALKLAGASAEEIAAQEAKLEQARANVNWYRAQIVKTRVYSPIAGTVTRVEAKIGEIAAANSPLLTVLSQHRLEVEAYLPEADIAKVKIGNPVKITLDAYGEEVVFEGKVAEIDPAETVIEGVSTYKTKIRFLAEDERIRPGMTANASILTDKREGVLYLPQRSVATREGRKYVYIYRKGKTEEREVQTGLRGSDGKIEILSGLKEGEKVLRLP
jgi:HlyD family secretion protein